MSTTLYETDFNQWIEETAKTLKEGNFQALDLENLIEEIEALGRSEKHELANRLEVLLEHLLKRCYMDSTYDNRGWELTIKEQRKQIRRLLKVSPSLENYGNTILNEIWLDALSDVQDLYPQANFPPQNPFSDTLNALLTETFWLP